VTAGAVPATADRRVVAAGQCASGRARELVTVALSGCWRLGTAFLSERYQGEAADLLWRVTS
jgi:hypothetical protein